MVNQEMRKIIYLDEAGRKKETEPLTSAKEIMFYQQVRQNDYTVVKVETVKEG
jgi:hypothetical protein